MRGRTRVLQLDVVSHRLLERRVGTMRRGAGARIVDLCEASLIGVLNDDSDRHAGGIARARRRIRSRATWLIARRDDRLFPALAVSVIRIKKFRRKALTPLNIEF